MTQSSRDTEFARVRANERGCRNDFAMKVPVDLTEHRNRPDGRETGKQTQM